MADLNSKYQRVFSIMTDKYGVDPLRDRLIPEITLIKDYANHVVSQEERGSPDLISINMYGSDEFWWVIMAYNGIGSYRKIVEGLTLKIPNMSSIVSIVTKNSIRPNKVQRVITI